MECIRFDRQSLSYHNPSGGIDQDPVYFIRPFKEKAVAGPKAQRLKHEYCTQVQYPGPLPWADFSPLTWAKRQQQQSFNGFSRRRHFPTYIFCAP